MQNNKHTPESNEEIDLAVKKFRENAKDPTFRKKFETKRRKLQFLRWFSNVFCCGFCCCRV